MNEFDLIDDPEIGEQFYKKGYQDGLKKASELFREVLLDTLIAQFQSIPNEITDKIHAIDNSNVLKELIIQTLSCPDIEYFKEKLL
ncbi:hypothetical protein [Candidatus Parabeggiatoa sp. HSG14]|uniref:hypothetical protein n=1 Tax=Candidatus Parabeggiatoa sp. HSG14 TaxID=3055593 RepID=UPI0025A8C0A2|nr:hypothetical protein [Thiotrichales bacterium HSG14]